MLTIIHGENIIQSRDKLVQVINQAKQAQAKVIRLSAERLQVPELESKLVQTDLFGNKRLIVLEGLHSLRRSKRKKQLIQLVTNSSVDVCLWEERKLTKNMLKKLEADQVFFYKLGSSVFKWLDKVGPKAKQQQLRLLQTALKDNDPYMCFAMLARQVRLLILAKDGGKIPGPGFVQRKVKRQARQFSLKRLLRLHQRLHQIDQQLKTSSHYRQLSQLLEWWTVTI
jgi:DNA polymerase III delta subunit